MKEMVLYLAGAATPWAAARLYRVRWRRKAEQQWFRPGAVAAPARPDPLSPAPQPRPRPMVAQRPSGAHARPKQRRARMGVRSFRSRSK